MQRVRVPDVGVEERPVGFVASISELARAGFDLAYNTARLAACEARVVVRKLALRIGLFFAFLVVAATGLLLIMQGIAALLETVAKMPAWASLVLVGVVTLCAGAFFAFRMLKRVGDKDIAFPATIAELEIDRDYLARRTKNQIGEGA